MLTATLHDSDAILGCGDSYDALVELLALQKASHRGILSTFSISKKVWHEKHIKYSWLAVVEPTDDLAEGREDDGGDESHDWELHPHELDRSM